MSLSSNFMEQNISNSSTMAANSKPVSKSSQYTHNDVDNSSSTTSKPNPELSSSILRLWLPNAQRNLRNQWSKLFSLRHQWFSCASSAHTHATTLVNSCLSIRYMDHMDIGVLSCMPNIKKKACYKLLKQQELQWGQLLSSYKSMVGVVCDMTNSSRSMRWYMKASSGCPLVEFTSSSENSNDNGDGGGAPIMTFFTISAFETLAEEYVAMFRQELLLKRLLVVELLSHTCEKHEEYTQLFWANELYHGEADDLGVCNLYSEITGEPCLGKIYGGKSKTVYVESNRHQSQEILQVYLTTWLASVNIDTYRVEEIIATVGEEMRISFS